MYAEVAKMGQIEQDLGQVIAFRDTGPRYVNMTFVCFDFLSLVLFCCCDLMVFNLKGNTLISPQPALFQVLCRK